MAMAEFARYRSDRSVDGLAKFEQNSREAGADAPARDWVSEARRVEKMVPRVPPRNFLACKGSGRVKIPQVTVIATS